MTWMDVSLYPSTLYMYNLNREGLLRWRMSGRMCELTASTGVSSSSLYSEADQRRLEEVRREREAR